MYSVRYYPRFHVTVVGLGIYYQWIRGHYCFKFVLTCTYSKYISAGLWRMRRGSGQHNLVLYVCRELMDFYVI
jgi:hypothetical protein